VKAGKSDLTMKYTYFREDKTETLLNRITEEEKRTKEFDEILENSYLEKSHIMDCYNYSK
jgi:hypothetical protein